MESYS